MVYLFSSFSFWLLIISPFCKLAVERVGPIFSYCQIGVFLLIVIILGQAWIRTAVGWGKQTGEHGWIRGKVLFSLLFSLLLYFMVIIHLFCFLSRLRRGSVFFCYSLLGISGLFLAFYWYLGNSGGYLFLSSLIVLCSMVLHCASFCLKPFLLLTDQHYFIRNYSSLFQQTFSFVRSSFIFFFFSKAVSIIRDSGVFVFFRSSFPLKSGGRGS